MRAIIIDAEILGRNTLANQLEEIINLEVVKISSNGRNGIYEISKLQPDIVFLNNALKDLNGFQVMQLTSTNPQPLFIIMSANPQDAMRAYDFGAFDFLLKPYLKERLFMTIKKAREYLATMNVSKYEERLQHLLKLENIQTSEKKSFSQIPIRIGNKTLIVDTCQIKYILASGSYSEICTNTDRHVIRESLSNLLGILNAQHFSRIHRSAIINLNFIQEIVHSNFSEIDVRMKDDKLLRVSKSQKQDFLEKMGF